MPLPNVPHIIPVLSGKGGVGKSSVTVQLALSLCLAGYDVGVLDIDLTGPSIPRLFGIENEKVRQAPGGWLPVPVHPSFILSGSGDGDADTAQRENGEQQRRTVGALHCMSLGFLLRSRGDAVIWRGPKKTAMVGQLLSEVLWPAGVEYLLIDTPPGTSDEHISLVTNLLDPAKFAPTNSSNNNNNHDIGGGEGSNGRGGVALGAVVVTTPQAISTADVRKELTFCAKVGLRVLGVVENMAGYVCPCCGEATNVFSKGGGAVMAREWGVRFLGSVPIDGEGWGMLVEEGRRPTYTAIGGVDGSAADTAAAAAAGGELVGAVETTTATNETFGPDQGRLVEKYTSCSLAPIFAEIARQLLNNKGDLPRGPSAATG